MASIEFFVGGFLVGVFLTLAICARARKACKKEDTTNVSDVTQQGSATTNAPDELSRIGRETGAEIIDD